MSRRQRDPGESPAAKPPAKDRDITWISDGWTAYARTGGVARIGDRP